MRALTAALRELRAAVRGFLPTGGSLPEDEFDSRHRLLVRALRLLAVLLPAYGVLGGGYPIGHTLLHAGPLAACAWLASRARTPARIRALACALGLLTAAALGVHMAGGQIEAHFSFFVVVAVLTLYEDWWPFGLAVGFTLLHHGVLGMAEPSAVFPPGERGSPWETALVHAAFIAAAGAGGLLTWRLNESGRRRMSALVEQVPAVTYVVEASGAPGEERLVYLSSHAVGILGLEPVDAPRPLAYLLGHIDPRDLEEVSVRLGEVRAGLPTRPLDFRFQRPDGGLVWLREHGAIVTHDGRRHLIQGLLFDVTKIKADETEHERMEQELRLAQKLESVGQLAAGVAHEINTPVQFVGDTVRFLEAAFEDLMVLTADTRAGIDAGLSREQLVVRLEAAEEAADLAYLQERVPAALERADDGIQRVGTIVRAMREFAHPPTTAMAPADVNEALRSTLVVAANEIKYVADVETDFGDVPPIVCNQGELNQVFVNLVVNAAHAITDVVGESGGRGLIRIATRSSDDGVLITIADTGGGIPDDVAARVFDPFFTTKEVGRGTGQGLAIARTLVVDRHGGHLGFTTDPGVGTTFEIRLPADAAASAVVPAVVGF